MSVQTFENITDYLGPPERRFFSAGYKRARYILGAAELDTTPETVRYRNALTVRYPSDWSTKDAGDQRPHLSTVDALVIALRVCSQLLGRSDNTDNTSVSLGKIVVSSGMAPQEDLTDIPVTAHLSTKAEPTGGSTAVGKFKCHVGSLKVTLTLDDCDHPLAERREPTLPVKDTPDATDYWMDGFRTCTHDIRSVHLDTTDRTATAAVFLDMPDTLRRDYGTLPSPKVPFVEGFVVSLQLAQMLIYEYDAMDRGSSNTLWMIRTTLKPALAAKPVDGIPARTRLTNVESVAVHGRTHRYVEFHSTVGDVEVAAQFAHDITHLAARA